MTSLKVFYDQMNKNSQSTENDNNKNNNNNTGKDKFFLKSLPKHWLSSAPKKHNTSMETLDNVLHGVHGRTKVQGWLWFLLHFKTIFIVCISIVQPQTITLRSQTSRLKTLETSIVPLDGSDNLCSVHSGLWRSVCIAMSSFNDLMPSRLVNCTKQHFYTDCIDLYKQITA